MKAKKIFEKFTEDSDPIKDMGIGVRASIKGWKKKIEKLDDKISNELGLRYVERGISDGGGCGSDVFYINEDDYMNDRTTSLPDLFRVSGRTYVLRKGYTVYAAKIDNNYLEISCWTNLIVDENQVIINKEEYLENLLKTIGIYSFLGEKEVSKNTISYKIKPQYVKYFKEA